MTAGPRSWLEIADELRVRIGAGRYPVGGLLPSTVALCREFGVSPGPVQRAVGALKAAGVVVGEPGRGVRIVAAPGTGRITLDRLAADVAELRERMDRHEHDHEER